MPEIMISLDKVQEFVERARAYEGRALPTRATDVSSGDNSQLEEAELQPDDATRQELEEFVAGLSEEERRHLFALFLVGREDYGWSDALAEADEAVLPLDDEALPEHIEAGLERIGRA